MSTYSNTVVRRRILIEMVDYAPTSERITSEEYCSRLMEDLDAMVRPAALEVKAIVELSVNETTITDPSKPVAPLALLPPSRPAGLAPEEMDTGNPVG